MSILSKYEEIMDSKIITLLDQSKYRDEDIEYLLKRLNKDLGEVKIKSLTLTAKEQRARHMLDECKVELFNIKKQIKNQTDVHEYNEQELLLIAKKNELTSLLYSAEQHVAMIRQMQDKLFTDLIKLEAYQQMNSKHAGSYLNTNCKK